MFSVVWWLWYLADIRCWALAKSQGGMVIQTTNLAAMRHRIGYWAQVPGCSIAAWPAHSPNVHALFIKIIGCGQIYTASSGAKTNTAMQNSGHTDKLWVLMQKTLVLAHWGMINGRHESMKSLLNHERTRDYKQHTHTILLFGELVMAN